MCLVLLGQLLCVLEKAQIEVMELELPKKLRKALEKEAKDAQISLNAHVIKKLEGITPPTEFIDKKKIERNIKELAEYLARIPGVSIVSHDVTADAYWWIKLDIDIEHRLSWNVVQELGFVLNYISLDESMPTVFKPVSPPPYLNGGPHEFLSWVIESTFNYIDPGWVSETLERRLPNPVDNETQWNIDEDDA